MALMARKAAANPNVLAFMADNGLVDLGAVDEFLRAHYFYRDEIEEVLRTPEFMLNDLTRIGYLEGDCDDISTLAAALFKALGYPVRFAAIRFDATNPNFEHVFTQVYDMAEWHTFDGTVQPGTQEHVLESMIQEV